MFPAKYTEIRHIKPTSGRVSVIGKVIKKNSEFAIDDGTGQILLETNQEMPLGKLVRIMGFVRENSIKVEIIQDFDGFDLDLYKRVKNYKELNV
jgi:hypothetical protein